MANDIFNRYEKKFLTDTYTASMIRERISEYMEIDPYSREHGSYTIRNIYYDTEDDRLIRNSISKPKYKEKLRLRAYCDPHIDSLVYLEIKKKFCGKVNKRRTLLTLGEAYSLTESHIRPEIKEYMNCQVIKEIEYFLTLYMPRPKLYLAYERKAYFDKGGSDLRISFDTDIRTRRSDLRLEYGDHGDHLLDSGQYLMEIKSSTNVPLWLSKLLSDLNMYSSGFSKYGEEYLSFLAGSKKTGKEGTVCLNHYSVIPLQVLQYH